MNIKPLSDRIVVEKEVSQEEIKSGIILPASNDAGGSNSIGVVVAVGPGAMKENGEITPVSVKIGDKVIFSWGDKVESGGKEYYIVSESSVLGVLEN